MAKRYYIHSRETYIAMHQNELAFNAISGAYCIFTRTMPLLPDFLLRTAAKEPCYASAETVPQHSCKQRRAVTSVNVKTALRPSTGPVGNALPSKTQAV